MSRRGSRQRIGQHLLGLLLPELTELLAKGWTAVSEDRDGEQASVGGAGFADCERADRDAAGHLHDREQGTTTRAWRVS